MERRKTNQAAKAAVLALLIATACIMTVAVPQEGSPTWLRDMLLTKAAAFAAAYAAYRCCRRWRVADKYADMLDKLIKE